MISWRERLSRLPVVDEELVEIFAQAIYMTHWHPRDYYQKPPPLWGEASENVRDGVRAQARSVVAVIRSILSERP